MSMTSAFGEVRKRGSQRECTRRSLIKRQSHLAIWIVAVVCVAKSATCFVPLPMLRRNLAAALSVGALQQVLKLPVSAETVEPTPGVQDAPLAAMAETSEPSAPDGPASPIENDGLAALRNARGPLQHPSGIEYWVITEPPPGAESIKKDDMVKLRTTGWINGFGFTDDKATQILPLRRRKDGSPDKERSQTLEDISFLTLETVGDKSVLPGWNEMLMDMKIGEERKFILPPNLGYGNFQNSFIPVNSKLYYQMEAIKKVPKPLDSPGPKLPDFTGVYKGLRDMVKEITVA